MTVSLAIVTVVDSIADLSVTGADILDLDEIPENVDGRKPVIFPKPDGFITALEVERMSQGSLGTALHDVVYTLNYRLCYGKVGEDRGLFKLYPDMVAIAVLFMNAILNNDVVTGLVDLSLAEAINFGPVSDPSGAMFHGCDFALQVLEFQN